MGIKEARKQKNMTQKQLAEAIGVGFTVISKYEKGTITPPSSRLEKIAQVLDTSVDFLLSDGSLIEVQTPSLQVRTHSEDINADRYEVNQSATLHRVLAYANGICELCGQKAPFTDKNGQPFLQIHHIKWLSEGGRPTMDNTVALCPNCHMKIHVVDDPADEEKLRIAASKHIEKRES